MGYIYYLFEAAKWLPVLITSAIFAWSWYAYVIQLVIYTIHSSIQQVLYLVIFNLFYLLAFWSYLRTVFARNNHRIPEKFYLTSEVAKELDEDVSDHNRREQILSNVVKQNELLINTRTYTGGIRYCEKCKLIKPDRCHHCSICRICVLKMDHHCPWINNCVSFSNYKFFVLFLGYLFILCLFTAITTFPFFMKLWLNNLNNGTAANEQLGQDIFRVTNNDPSRHNGPVPFGVRFQVLFLFFVSGMLTFGVMFLYFYHIHLLLRNRTTLEAFRQPLMTYGPDRNAFNLGFKENFKQLFGRSPLLWLLPVPTTEGNGLVYKLRPFAANDEEARQELFNSLANSNKITYNRNNQSTNISN